MKRCKFCQSKIDIKATRCPKCQGDLRSWWRRHPILTFLMILFGVPAIVGYAAGENISEDLPKPTPIPQQGLKGDVNFDGSQFTITNKEDRNWESCQMTLNGKYRYPQERGLLGSETEVLEIIEAKETYTVGVSAFVLKDGTRFNPFSTKVGDLIISCSNGSEYWTW